MPKLTWRYTVNPEYPAEFVIYQVDPGQNPGDTFDIIHGELRSCLDPDKDGNAILRLLVAAPALYEALSMVRDADDDCLRDGLQSIPYAARMAIDNALALAGDSAAAIKPVTRLPEANPEAGVQAEAGHKLPAPASSRILKFMPKKARKPGLPKAELYRRILDSVKHI